ncbi:Type III restriction enzyme, res subunit [Anatilimnocola aggregata]|uniref:Type III restriction enzyme, res subunit n=2 Tax=Anatilimnocola aggregata TaxID=2528021 RepID=A0A517YM83_9BACT|nr:Type III restriction enzyme, res subunit [Anatilimnocola aggregata]
MALADFRQGLTGRHALQQLTHADGRLLINLPVGVGKTELIIRIIQHISKDDTKFDAVLLMVPRNDILEEVLKRLPASVERSVLRPRPFQRCGDLNREWQSFEKSGCA